MKNVFFFGASILHGVGGPQGGWADKLKSSLHRDLYGEDAAGEVCEVYELGVPGATTDYLLARMVGEIKARIGMGTPDDTYIVVLTGANDSKAVGEPDKFLVTPEDFRTTMDQVLAIAKTYSTHVIVLGLTPVDERKVNPKHNPISDTYSYFTNDRIAEFDGVIRLSAEAAAATFVPLYENAPDNWVDTRLFTDGIHPNDAGHEWIRSQVEPELRKMIGDLA